VPPTAAPPTPTYDQAARAFRSHAVRLVPHETLRDLHRLSGWRHAAVALRQAGLLALAVFAILRWGDRWWAWIPASLAIGVVAFSFTILLHEVVHGTVTARRRPRLLRALGLLYAIPSGISASQFTRWHLDHHEHLGTEEADPKRHWLTPKIVRRWYKALYLTPALFPIYFRAARREAASYDAGLRRRIAWERRAAIAFHLGVPAALWLGLGFEAALKIHLLPIFVVFPVLFTVNRLGQHYDVEPTDPARWGTLLRPSPWLWDPLYLWSNYHLEHHYFPKVPFYRLRALRRAVEPFFRERGVPSRTYGRLLWGWFVRNRTPHTNWDLA
jgi:fatty acid desaturase